MNRIITAAIAAAVAGGLLIGGAATADAATLAEAAGQTPLHTGLLTMSITNTTNDTWTLATDDYGTGCVQEQAPLQTLGPGDTTYPEYDLNEGSVWHGCNLDLDVLVAYTDPSASYQGYAEQADLVADIPAYASNNTAGTTMNPQDPAYAIDSSITHGVTAQNYTATYSIIKN
jgi:alternate signal-mediated exported protein